MQGVVKRVNERGYFFIQPTDDSDSRASHFAHAKELRDLAFEEIQVGQVLEFESQNSEKGLQARNIFAEKTCE